MELTRPPQPAQVSPVPRRFVRWLATFIVLLGLVFVALEWEQIRDALSQATWGPFPFALAAIGLSYLGKSMSFVRVSRLLQIPMRTRDLLPVGFISTVLNHVVASGGAAGYTVRYALMNRHGVGFSQVVAVSILHFVFTSVIMIAMLPVGLIYLLSNVAMPPTTGTLLTALTVVVVLGTLLLLALIFSGRLRARLFGLVERIARRLLRRETGETLAAFDATVTLGADSMRRRPIEILWLALFIGLDWVASVATLYFAFRSLGVTVAPWTLVSGFVIGVVTGVASMIPGGLGVQEGTMAGVFSLYGLEFDRAVLAAVFYRATYFILPYLISLGFYQWMLRRDPSRLASAPGSQTSPALPPEPTQGTSEPPTEDSRASVDA